MVVVVGVVVRARYGMGARSTKCALADDMDDLKGLCLLTGKEE